MQITFNEHSDIPIYQQIVDRITRDIRGGILPAGYKLPTVRALADEAGASRGTVKHAYDTLEQLGLIHKLQGSGTFVSDLGSGAPTSKKEQALLAIDGLLDRMQELGFSMRDIRIYVELKLREREQMVQNVRVCAVDCNPEALSVIRDQVAALPHADVYEYLLQTVLDSPARFSPGMDLYLTTRTHFEELGRKMGSGQKLLQVVMAVPTDTVLELSRIPGNARTGILCQSERFAQIIRRGIERYCRLEHPPETALFGHDGLESFLERIDRLILPPNHLRFCPAREQELLRQHREQPGVAHIVHRYQIERGSLLYLEEEIETLYKTIEERHG